MLFHDIIIHIQISYWVWLLNTSTGITAKPLAPRPLAPRQNHLPTCPYASVLHIQNETILIHIQGYHMQSFFRSLLCHTNSIFCAVSLRTAFSSQQVVAKMSEYPVLHHKHCYRPVRSRGRMTLTKMHLALAWFWWDMMDLREYVRCTVHHIGVQQMKSQNSFSQRASWAWIWW